MHLIQIRKINSARGFTIVELLIVIVVIGILAAISIVAYNGIQARAQDTQRLSEMDKIKKSLAIYYQLNGQYPACGGNQICTTTGAWGSMSDLPITPSVQDDPKNSDGNWGYYYALGYKKNSSGQIVQTNNFNDYLLGTRLVNGQVPTYNAWNNSNLNYIYSISSS